MAGIFVMGVMPVTTAKAVKAATTAKAVKAATIVTIVTTGGKGPLPTAKTATERTETDPQAGASLTVRPALRMAIARRGMIATVREDGLRVLREMTDRAATTAKIGPTVRTGQIVQTARIGPIAQAVRTGRTETAVTAARIVAPVVTVTEARVVGLVVAPAVIKTVAVAAGRTNVLALAAASPNRPMHVLTVPHLRQWCGS